MLVSNIDNLGGIPDAKVINNIVLKMFHFLWKQ
jgi:UDP-N-acetylglucosamine pyrophosphorylase